MARQWFTSDGPLAFLPLPDPHLCSIVWSVTDVKKLKGLSGSELCQLLTEASEKELGNVTGVDVRFSFPLKQQHSFRYVKKNMALIGDAAHTIHPLAGQGVNLGLMDVQALSEELLRAQQRQLSFGSLAVLERYQRRRKAANLSMMAGTEGFKRLFEEPALPVRWARNVGMRWLDGVAPLKHKVMRGAMGL